MGEKIRDIGEFNISGERIQIELNDGYSKQHSKYDIHIQSNSVQYNLTNSDFIKLAATIINAREHLIALKKMGEEDNER
ncbi:hypothetical protein [Pseudobutyrivibrio xylanivorans]|uniref:Uncharacterized protein n=1 Tax=Pseudobutyrivibrio xylanivorans TaxID=185007 RepID=A0A5P6VQV7_PSEXY|nr:hypothetical protein [Pseudobutyrivibrio xylanivorans]QFJ54996.1 hypothetical protein FXF36_09040 [Pseudobutyrivibrio xylanivorans]